MSGASGGAGDRLLAPNGGAFARGLDAAELGADENASDDDYGVVMARFEAGPVAARARSRRA